jgi:hypothetical protein
LLREIRRSGRFCYMQYGLRAMISRNKYPQRRDLEAFVRKITPTGSPTGP